MPWSSGWLTTIAVGDVCKYDLTVPKPHVEPYPPTQVDVGSGVIYLNLNDNLLKKLGFTIGKYKDL